MYFPWLESIWNIFVTANPGLFILVLKKEKKKDEKENKWSYNVQTNHYFLN